ncbi:MAG: hypothetical protein R3224_05350, partial [Balneolaceae bacterium]|nr:hypothetical protein [Balneolaceae bacterium]
MRKILLLALFIFVSGIPLGVAQNFDFGLALNGGFPQGKFRSNVGSDGIGLDMVFAYGPRYSPVSVGVDLGFITYGSSTRKEFFNPSIPEVLIGVRTTNNILTGHFFTRVESKQGPVRPYFDGLIGLNYLWTESR